VEPPVEEEDEPRTFPEELDEELEEPEDELPLLELPLPLLELPLLLLPLELEPPPFPPPPPPPFLLHRSLTSAVLNKSFSRVSKALVASCEMSCTSSGCGSANESEQDARRNATIRMLRVILMTSLSLCVCLSFSLYCITISRNRCCSLLRCQK
jgi:hypothetical protein